MSDVGPDAPGAPPDGLPVPRRYFSAVAIWLAIIMAVLDSSIANVALPTIGEDLNASASSTVWIVNAYQISVTMMLLPVAALSEIVGYRRVYVTGLLLFIAASFACAVAPDLTTLSVARFVQGLGGAGVMAINGALLRFTYPRAHLGRGLGYNALVVAASTAAGPTVAAVILSIASWRWLFAVNVPFGLLALAVGLWSLPDAKGRAGTFDIKSALLNALALGLVFLGVTDIAHDEISFLTVAKFAVGLLAGFLLVRRVREEENPLVPLDLMKVPLLRLSYLTSSSSFAAQMIALVALPFFLQERFGYGHVEVGLLITPMPLAIAVAAPVAGRLVDRFSAGLLGSIGLAVLACGLLLFTVLPAQADTGLIVLAMIVCGLGFGTFQTPNNRVMLGVAPPHRSGAAAGMLATARLVGQTAGAVLVALMFHVVGPQSVVPFVVAAGFAAIAAGLSLRRLSI